MKKMTKRHVISGEWTSHTSWLAPCYTVIPQGRKRPWGKSGHVIDPAIDFQVKGFLNVKDGDGKMQLARLNLIDPNTKKPALISAGDIAGSGTPMDSPFMARLMAQPSRSL